MKAQNFNRSKAKQVKLRTLSRLCVLLICSIALNASANPLPDIIRQPTNQMGAVFGSAMFSVTAESALPLSYQWMFDGEPIADATNAQVILGPLNCTQNGYYNVIVSNASGAVSSSKAKLTVCQTIVSTLSFGYGYGVDYGSNAQDFLLQFTNVMVATVGSFTLYALNSDGTVVSYDTDDSDSGVPAQDLIVPSGLFNVVAISSGLTHVLALRGDGTIAAWGTGPTNVPGGLLSITAIAAGGSANIVLQSNGTTAEFGDLSSPPPPLSNVVAIAAGEDQILALHADGTVAEFRGDEAQVVAGLSNVIAIAAGAGSLALKADGTVVGWDGLATNPLPNVSNLVAIAMNANAYFVYLALKSDGTVAEPAGSAAFPFAVSNVFAIAVSGTLGGIAMVSNGAPVFTVQPGNQAPTNGGTVWLHARAVGVQPMSYQWQLDGTNIPGATNADLTITNAQGEDIGQYCALASNNLGSASSHLASVTITPAAVPYTLAQALDATNLTWSTFGNAVWFPEVTYAYDGIAAAQSGRITNSMYSELQTTVTGPGTLTFWWMVSSEEFFDFLSFYIGPGTHYAARISGELDWEQETFLIGPGSQTLSWIYAKDPDVSVGQDAGWVDQVSFTPTLPAQLSVPMLLSDGSLLFDVYTTNGNSLALSNPSSVLFEASSNLIDWIPLTNALTLTNGSALLRDPSASNAPVRFYRLMRQ
jgi:hypothetical protein